MDMFGAALLLAALRLAAAQDANCDYTQYTQTGQTYYIYSPNYNSNYSGPLQCRWIAIAPTGYQNVLDCSVIQLPATQGCYLDRLMISRSGDPQLSGADVYCGRGTTTAVSSGPRLVVGLIAANNSPGGKFYCQLTVQRATTTPTCSCGYKKRNRIVGGQETGVNEFPMMAGVADVAISRMKCGATIVDKRYVVTAAHCVINRALDDFIVVVGEHDVTTGDSSATQGISIERITTHPQYNSSNYDYDIALLRLRQDIQFSDLVGPACLPFKFAGTDLTGSNLTLLGWGTLFIGGPTSDTLRKVDVQMISQSSCRQQVPSLTDRQLCTYTPGKDACQDDSGGPGLFTDPSSGRLHLLATISYGRSCASGSPGVSARVAALLPWIQDNSPDATYCRG